MKRHRDTEFTLVLLAGGKSSRMGQNKGLLLYQGKTFAENLIEKGKQLGIEQILVSGLSLERQDVQVVKDIYPERGPLGGIHACLTQMKTPFALVIPVDVPQIPMNVLDGLLTFYEQYLEEPKEKHVPIVLEHGERRENLIGIYPKSVTACIEDLIREHSAAVRRVFEEWGYQCCKMEIPEWQVDNINTPEAYQRLLEISR